MRVALEVVHRLEGGRAVEYCADTPSGSMDSKLRHEQVVACIVLVVVGRAGYNKSWRVLV